MFSKNLIFSAAIGLLACTSCEVSKAKKAASDMPMSATESLDAQIEKLQRKRDYTKARIYEETDESMRTEFNANWEDYRGHLSRQEFFEQRLKDLDAELDALQKKKQALQGSK